VTNEWEEVALGDLIKKGQADLQTGPFGTMLNASEYCDSGVPVIAVQDIGENVLRHEKLIFVSNDTAERLNKYRVKKGDIIFGRKGAVDRRALIKDVEQDWVQGSDCIRLRLRECFEPRFVSYQFGTDSYKDWMMQFSTGATMPSLNQDVLKLLPILCPPLAIQRAIAEVLSSLDDKIDLLTRQNATLEALAQTYFRQWFVEESESASIAVSKIALLENNSINPVKQPLEPFYHYSIPAFDNAQTPAIEFGKTILSNKFSVLPNTILVSKLNPVTPRVWRIGEYVPPNSVCSTEFQVLKPKEKRHYLFLYCLMKSNDVVSNFAMSTTGTSGSHQRIRPEYILEVETPTPDDNELALFNEVCTPMMERVKKNQQQIQTLQKLRNTLLPKLISGEVRIK
jgi:type I restriction enzyme S subunit